MTHTPNSCTHSLWSAHDHVQNCLTSIRGRRNLVEKCTPEYSRFLEDLRGDGFPVMEDIWYQYCSVCYKSRSSSVAETVQAFVSTNPDDLPLINIIAESFPGVESHVVTGIDENSVTIARTEEGGVQRVFTPAQYVNGLFTLSNPACRCSAEAYEHDGAAGYDLAEFYKNVNGDNTLQVLMSSLLYAPKSPVRHLDFDGAIFSPGGAPLCLVEESKQDGKPIGATKYMANRIGCHMVHIKSNDDSNFGNETITVYDVRNGVANAPTRQFFTYMDFVSGWVAPASKEVRAA